MIGTYVTTEGLMKLCENSQGRNRSIHMKHLRLSVDPFGKHVLFFSMTHNDVELRTAWMVKVKGNDVPVKIWLDVDFDVFEEHTIMAIVKEEDNGEA